MITVLGKNKSKGEYTMPKGKKKEEVKTEPVIEEEVKAETEEEVKTETEKEEKVKTEEKKSKTETETETAQEKEVVKEDPPHVVKDEPIEVKKLSGIVDGLVSNCNALRLREGANMRTRTMGIMPVDTKVKVNLDNSTDSFYEIKVTLGGVELIGYCSKRYIELVE